MDVYRIVKEEFSFSLFSSGAANRWNLDNEYVLYSGESRSLATLELIVHRAAIHQGLKYKVLVLSLPDNDKFYTTISLKYLPKNWRSFESYSKLQQIGSEWYLQNTSLIIRVPSAVIPQEFNYIINTKHPEFKKNVKLKRVEDYFWDERIL